MDEETHPFVFFNFNYSFETDEENGNCWDEDASDFLFLFGTGCRDLCSAELSWLLILCALFRVHRLQQMHLTKVSSSGSEFFSWEALNSKLCLSFLCRYKVRLLPNVWSHHGQHLEKSILETKGKIFLWSGDAKISSKSYPQMKPWLNNDFFLTTQPWYQCENIGERSGWWG